MHTHSAAQTQQWTTGWPEFDQLIENKWMVESSDEEVVNLRKGKETKVFHKPKNN
ncbi:hypothetical protein K2Q08_03045 [Patescibacteria group bacterium]|nr:hypothetical protein [Patescibacteria group bacterium]